MADEALRNLFFDIGFDIDVKKVNDVNKEMDELTKNVKDLGKENKDVGVKTESSSKKMKKGFTEAEKETKKTSKSVKEIGTEAEKSEKKSGKLGKTLGAVGVGLKGLGTVAGIGMAAVGTSVVAVGGIAIKTAIDFDEAYKIIAASTGAAGEELEAYKQSLKTIAANADESIGQIAPVMADISVRTGKTGKDLEEFTGQILDMGDAIEDDFGTVAMQSIQTMEKWNVDVANQSKTLDKFMVASQKSGISIQTLTSSLTTNATFLQGMGYGLDDSISLLANFEAAGINAESITGSMRIAMSKFAAEGITDMEMGMEILQEKVKGAKTESEALGISVQYFGRTNAEMAKAIRAGTFDIDAMNKTLAESEGLIGRTADNSKSFGDKLDELKNKGLIALEPIGQKLLDIGEKIFPVLESALPRITDLFTGVFDKVGPILDDLMPMFDGLQAQILPSLLDLFGELATTIMPVLMDTFGIIAKDIFPVFAEILGVIIKDVLPPVITLFGTIVKELLPPLAELFGHLAADLLPPIAEIFGQIVREVLPPLVTLFKALIKDVLPPISKLLGELVAKVLPPMVKIISKLLEAILPPLIDIINALMKALIPLIDVYMNLIDPIMMLIDFGLKPFMLWIEAIKTIAVPVIEFLGEKLATVFGGISNVIGGVVDFITDVFMGNWEGAWTTVVSTFGTIWDGMKAVFTTPINFIIQGINELLGFLNTITIPDWVPEIGGFGFSFEPIAALKKGSADAPNEFIAGENGPEFITGMKGSRVIPASRTRRESEAGVVSRGQGIVVNVNVTIQGNTDEAFLSKMKKEMKPVVKEAVSEALDDAAKTA